MSPTDRSRPGNGGTRFAADSLADLNAHLGALADSMGIEFTEATPERYVATMPVTGNTQPYGILHGGASVVLAETVGSAMSMALAGPDRAAVGMTINATHHRPASSGVVTGTATVIAHGRTTAATEIVITDERGRRVCTATLLATLLDALPAPRRAAPTHE